MHLCPCIQRHCQWSNFCKNSSLLYIFYKYFTKTNRQFSLWISGHKSKDKTDGLVLNISCSSVTSWRRLEHCTWLLCTFPTEESSFVFLSHNWKLFFFFFNFLVTEAHKTTYYNFFKLVERITTVYLQSHFIYSFICFLVHLTFRHRTSCILGQALHYSSENAFYIFNQQIYFIIWYLLDHAS